ncbi:alpha/beta hydrolase, partial [Streptomyces sp. KLMMK]|uniref:alpha/beta hydrolase n=1 Tax=Streptomyces sp. KLMMK TaxID=3109353 RepID=UPI003008893B
LVALGSPGMRADSAAGLHTGARVWAAARNSSDWIGNVPNVDLFGLGHGTDPTSPEFGARVVPTHGAHGHTGYFAPGTDSLRNFADIALGAYASVR